MAESERSARELEKRGGGGDWDAASLVEELQRRGDNEGTYSCPEILRRRDGELVGEAGGGLGETERGRGRDKAREREPERETASRGRQSEKDREAAETMRETDTPDGERPKDLDR